MSSTYRHSRGAIFLISMIAHKGENVIIGSRFSPLRGEFSLDDYEVYCVVSNISGRETREKAQVVNADDNAVAHVIKGTKTRDMEGLYFISFELWANGERVLSNEVEQLTIIE